ncbi:acyl-CoA-binding protein-like [Salarias fasciatus]|uniref:Acyl-CoA-binding protein-like n=1 Tax=Salarias fasciatus TaxID=181472 RepID=A0A672FR42_SALFA|nr:acyl-CoA-binding protein-like [Salarias fasciatus]
MSDAFPRAVEEVKVLLKKPATAELSQLYGLYKQATEGDVSTERPGILNFTAVAKWDAWNSRKGLSQDKAKAEYVQLVETLKAKYGI